MSTIENWVDDISREIIELHEFFQNWFNGSIPESNFTRFSAVMGEGFKIISPSGDLTPRSNLVKMLRDSYGKNSKIKISARNITVKLLCEGTYLALYDEIQEQDLEITARISTAIFQIDLNQVNNVVWIHVHETWK